MERVVEDVPCRRALRPQERQMLETKKKEEKHHSFYKFRYNFLTLMMLLVMTSNFLNYTYASFTDIAQVNNNIFRADDIKNHLLVTPGSIEIDCDSKSKYEQTANIDKNGQLYIDFGKVELGSQKSYEDLVTLKNITNKPLLINWWWEGPIAKVMGCSEDNKFYLLPTKSKTTILDKKILSQQNPYFLGINLNPKEKGTFAGNMVITVNGNFLSLRIPTKLVVFPGDNEERRDDDRDSTVIINRNNIDISNPNSLVSTSSSLVITTSSIRNEYSNLVTPSVTN